MNLLSFKNISKKDFEMKYERRLVEYHATLDEYKKSVNEYLNQMDSVETKTLETHLKLMQTSLDLAQIKEQNDLILELLRNPNQEKDEYMIMQLDHIHPTLLEMNERSENLEKHVIENIMKVLVDMEEQSLYQYKETHSEWKDKFNKLSKDVRGSKGLLWFFVLIQVVSTLGILFLILDKFQLLPF